jgi:serine/threonine-protein kinase
MLTLEPGLRITENIELRFPLGEGGMGRVWAADHVALGRQVAVKFVALALVDDADTLQRFALEAQTLARLQSPYAPQVYDYGVLPDGTPFIVMELLSGVTLQVHLGNEGLLSLGQTALLVNQVCSVLSSAHALGIIHRDIKPANIVLVAGVEGALAAKVFDFGIAKADTGGNLAGLTRTGTTLGTPSFMSPEQLLGAKAVDARADLWSVAVVAYCCLTSELPFAGDTFGAVCMAIHAGGRVDPSAHRPGLPPALDAWFCRAFSGDIEERFASAAEMAATFVQAADKGLPDAHAPALEGSDVHPVHSVSGAVLASTPRRNAPARDRWLLGAVTAFTLTAVALAWFAPSWWAEGTATERQAMTSARAAARWGSSVTFRWPIAAGVEPSAVAASSAEPSPQAASSAEPSPQATPAAAFVARELEPERHADAQAAAPSSSAELASAKVFTADRDAAP